MDEIVTALAGSALVESLLQCMENELGGRSTRDLPADDPSGEDVDGPVQRTKAVYTNPLQSLPPRRRGCAHR